MSNSTPGQRFWTVRLCAWTATENRSFGLLSCDSEDLRQLPLIERKRRLRSIVPQGNGRLLYCDHVEGDGVGLFQLACENDLEGVVAKDKFAPYFAEGQSTWFKVRNRSYSQWVGREELFERERGSDPDAHGGWDSCVLACAGGRERGQGRGRNLT